METEQNIEQLNSELKEHIGHLLDESNAVSKLERISYQSKSRISWNGGIIGAIVEHKEEKRIVNILNTVIYNDIKYIDFPNYIYKIVKSCVLIQQQIQSLIDKENDYYYGNVELLKSASKSCISSWSNFSDVAFLRIKKDGTSIYIDFENAINNEFQSIDKPKIVNKVVQDYDSRSGCLGIALIIIFVASILSI